MSATTSAIVGSILQVVTYEMPLDKGFFYKPLDKGLFDLEIWVFLNHNLTLKKGYIYDPNHKSSGFQCVKFVAKFICKSFV